MVDLLIMLGVFVFAIVVGYLLISKVPALLHTPLMSMTNAISAITVIGALVIFAAEIGDQPGKLNELTIPEKVLGSVALVMAMFNVVGGFAITDRMLKLFRK